MKKSFTILLNAAVLMIFLVSSIYAQSDVLVVHASKNGAPNFLNEVVDANPNVKTFKLVSRDTCYLFSDQITLDRDVEFIGELDPTTNRPPTIQPYELGDGSVPAILFNFSGKGTTVAVKNLYLLSVSNNNTKDLPNSTAIQVTNDNIRLTVDNCVFDGWVQFAIGYSGNYDKFFIHNCHFRNMVHPTQWYVGEVIRNLWPGNSYTDTLSMVNNTMFCVNGYSAAPVTKYYMKHFEFVHNTVAYTFKNPFFIFNVTDAKINDNIFYGNWAGGTSKAEYPWWDQLWSPEFGSVIDLDTLDLAKDSVFAPDLVGDPDMRMKAEARRNVQVKNNVYFWDQSIKDMWTNWNDTNPDSLDVYLPTWMNDRTTNMFTDNTTWPGFDADGNQDADPEFAAEIENVVTQTENGLKAWFELCRSGNLSTAIWGMGITEPTGDPTWVPTWPLPENLAYSNSALMTASSGGYPVGDLNWFPDKKAEWITGIEVIDNETPEAFTLAQNYPNPFNPATKISFAIAEDGNVSLKVYNVNGELVKTLVNNEDMPAGTYVYTVDMSDVASGVYFYSLRANENVATKKMVLIK